MSEDPNIFLISSSHFCWKKTHRISPSLLKIITNPFNIHAYSDYHVPYDDSLVVYRHSPFLIDWASYSFKLEPGPHFSAK